MIFFSFFLLILNPTRVSSGPTPSLELAPRAHLDAIYISSISLSLYLLFRQSESVTPYRHLDLWLSTLSARTAEVGAIEGASNSTSYRPNLTKKGRN